MGMPFTQSATAIKPTATDQTYTLSLHDALPISPARTPRPPRTRRQPPRPPPPAARTRPRERGAQRSRLRAPARSEEHTSELQSHSEHVRRLLLEKKKRC